MAGVALGAALGVTLGAMLGVTLGIALDVTVVVAPGVGDGCAVAAAVAAGKSGSANSGNVEVVIDSWVTAEISSATVSCIVGVPVVAAGTESETKAAFVGVLVDVVVFIFRLLIALIVSANVCPVIGWASRLAGARIVHAVRSRKLNTFH
jgi:hypothetical protein